MNKTARNSVDDGARRLAPASAYPRRDAEHLLMHVLGCSLAELMAHPERFLSVLEAGEYESLLARRANSEPMQYILGEQEFYGLPLKVTPAVLIPRPETELVVETALSLIDRSLPLEIADVGVGSGAIGIALAHELPSSTITAFDISAAALEVARENAVRNGVLHQMRFVQADLLQAAQPRCFDLIVSNPPYVASGERLEPQVERYEPHSALYAGATGLEVYERLIPQAGRALRTGGWLVLEVGAGQKVAVARLLGGWQQARFVNDLQAIPRVAVAHRAVDNKD